jgi:flagellin
MSLIINHNINAMKAAHNLGTLYNRLGKSVERLSSGLRINNAADDAAGLAVRELMRADIAAIEQGVRNAADALSMVQTADGALGVIDNLLCSMRSLAEQATNATYSTSFREMINSEYQAMAAEIDRIANTTSFNGIKLLDGSLSSLNLGRGLLVHFGIQNSYLNDYYYIKADDVRATSSTGLRIGGDGQTDIWSTGAYNGLPYSETIGCCGGGFSGLDETLQSTSAQAFMYGYNWDNTAANDTKLLSAHYVAGRYNAGSGATLEEIASLVNKGTQSRVVVNISGSMTNNSANYTMVCLGDDEAYYFASADSGVNAAKSAAGSASVVKSVDAATASALGEAINLSSKNFWAMVEGSSVYIFAKDPGNHNDWKAQEKGTSAKNLSALTFTNVLTGVTDSAIASFSLGGQKWAAMELSETGHGNVAVALVGHDIGDGKDIRILDGSDTTVISAVEGVTASWVITRLSRSNFTELQDAADGDWDGSHIRTQEAGQKAFEAVNEAIISKDEIRAKFGTMAQRLEATIETMSIQALNTQAAESRISDVDVAAEMTEYTKNNVLVQAATAMLAQANSLSNLALTLLM